MMMMMNSEEKYKFKIWKRKDGLISVKVWETKREEEGARKFVEELLKILETVEGKVKILSDATMAKFGPTSKA